MTQPTDDAAATPQGAGQPAPILPATDAAAGLQTASPAPAAVPPLGQNTPPGYGPQLGYGPAPQYAPPPGYGPPPGYPVQPGYGPPPVYGPPPGYPQPTPVALSPGGHPLASFGDRLGAYLIDTGIFTLVGMVLSIPLGVYLVVFWLPDVVAASDPYGPEPDPSTFFREFLLPLLLMELVLFAVVFVGYYVYHVQMMYKTGQTIGKKVMKIRIVPIDPAATLTRDVATKRYLVEFVAGSLVPFLTYVDGFWQLWDKPYKQTLHDKAAKTVVIKVPS